MTDCVIWIAPVSSYLPSYNFRRKLYADNRNLKKKFAPSQGAAFPSSFSYSKVYKLKAWQ